VADPLTDAFPAMPEFVVTMSSSTPNPFDPSPMSLRAVKGEELETACETFWWKNVLTRELATVGVIDPAVNVVPVPVPTAEI